MQLEQFQRALKTAHIAAAMTLLVGTASTAWLGAWIPGLLFSLMLAVVVHCSVYIGQCRRHVSGLLAHVADPPRRQAADDDEVLSQCHPTGNPDIDYHLEVYASLHGYDRRMVRALVYALVALLLILAASPLLNAALDTALGTALR